MSMSPATALEIAGRLQSAWVERAPVPPLSESDGLDDVEDAYAIQTAWSRLRVAAGEEIVGWKIGLTSAAVQAQVGVDEPDFGTLWASRHLPVNRGRASGSVDSYIQPKLEGELAFLLGDQLPDGAGLTAEDVLAATEAVAPSIEIVDSRIEDWRISLVDTVADNASYGGFCHGDWSALDPQTNLAELGMTVSCNGEKVASGHGSDALGHPANCVAWLLNKLATLGVRPGPGDIILSGAWAATVPIRAGDHFLLDIDGQSPLELTF